MSCGWRLILDCASLSMTESGRPLLTKKSSFPTGHAIVLQGQELNPVVGWRFHSASLTNTISYVSKTSMDANNEAERVRPRAEASEEPDFLPDKEGPAVEVPIEDSLDLHTFSPGEIKPLIEEYLYQCQRREFHEVRIIHGRGTGTQRKIVRSLLARNPRVAAFKDAAPESGGWGATMVTLKP